MPDISKLTKAQLIDIIQKQEEDKYAVLKEELGLVSKSVMFLWRKLSIFKDIKMDLCCKHFYQ